MTAFPLPKEGLGLMTIAFDLDGTLAEPTWPDPKVGAPIPLGVRALQWYAAQGYEIIVYTSRPASHRAAIAHWLFEQRLDGIVYDIVTDKPRAALYIDDRAISFPFAEPQECPPRRMLSRFGGSVHDEVPGCTADGECHEVRS